MTEKEKKKDKNNVMYKGEGKNREQKIEAHSFPKQSSSDISKCLLLRRLTAGNSLTRKQDIFTEKNCDGYPLAVCDRLGVSA